VPFHVVMGRPHVSALWESLRAGGVGGTLSADQRLRAKQLNKAIQLLESDPRHPGLRSHEIEALSRRVGVPVFDSYLENQTPAAGRLFWLFGPSRGCITVIGLEPHPGQGKRAYGRVLLSLLPSAP
jgi:hypothetical protein